MLHMLPNEVVLVSSVSSVKEHLDKLWYILDLYYNYKAKMRHRKSQVVKHHFWYALILPNIN